MPGCDADYGSQIVVDHHLPVCLRRLGAMKPHGDLLFGPFRSPPDDLDRHLFAA